MQKRIVYASLKIWKSNSDLHQHQSSLLQEASRLSSIAPLRSEVSIVIKCFVSLPDN